MGKYQTALGLTIGRLTIIKRLPQDTARREDWWLCKCNCGKEHKAKGYHLRAGMIQSCGCLLRERLLASNLKHGAARRSMVKSSEYNIWNSMKDRCRNPRNLAFEYYGGRGIKVCPEWSESFETFLSDMGPRPTGLSIDRINNDGNYEPGNCRWATRKQQSINKRARRFFKKP